MVYPLRGVDEKRAFARFFFMAWGVFNWNLSPKLKAKLSSSTFVS
jgi:hypothetical protein